VRADSSGYVQRVDVEALVRLATQHDIVVRIDARPGCFVTERDAIFTAHPPDRVSDDVADLVRKTWVVGQERTPQQDLEFSIRRMVEIAQRALSPGINDPTTALYCIDRLGEAFGRLADRDIPSPLRFDDQRRLRVMTEAVTLEELACPAFAAIARYGIADADVVVGLCAAMDMLSRTAPPEASKAILNLSEAIGRESRAKSLDLDQHAVQAAATRGG
jgi:uncharacterized membrane protein